MNQKHAALFEVWGVEIESMIVDAATLDVRPIADELLRDASGGGEWVEDVEAGVIGWSNELVAHLIELKNVAPVPTLGELPAEFLASVQRANALLSARGARLLPTAMHPWMRPAQETRIWPHDSAPIYGAYDALFDCRRHGWANLQSVHLNLPFADEREFGRLMAAVRVALPLIPALAASSPIVEGRATGRLDNRLDVYRDNATRVPAMAGEVIPEPVFDYEGYRRDVLAPITQQLAPIGADPALLDQERTNARGAIARFDR
ncbi:MAG: glutamate--cysteine ligase, partial [Planctomycetes bacterium]|nr:glutamate--cysteine ligase [Planctomycetota bacterium]